VSDSIFLKRLNFLSDTFCITQFYENSRDVKIVCEIGVLKKYTNSPLLDPDAKAVGQKYIATA
jgi:hypothetical protein